MKKLVFLTITVILALLVTGCSDTVTNTEEFFQYDLVLRLPKGAVIGEDYTPSDVTSPYYDEYHVAAKSEDDVIVLKAEGSYFEPFEISLNPDIKSLDCTTSAVLKEGEERKIINSAATYVIGLYYAAQNSEKDIPLESYLFSGISDEAKKKLEEYYGLIKSSFASLDEDGSVDSHGMYDLMFSDFFGNVTKNDNGTFTANVTLSYSYIFKHPDNEDNDVFSDIVIKVDMTRENEKWVVIDLENPLII